LLEGKRLVSYDDSMFIGSSKAIADYDKENEDVPLWTNSVFSGMPTYLIGYGPKNNLIAKVFSAFATAVPIPANQMFWAMFGFYIMLLTFGFKPYASAVGAIAYGFCSYNIGIVTAGHYAKLWAIAFFPLIVAGINLLFKKKYLWGALLVGVATSVEILVNHPQMTYYYFVFFLSLYLIYLFVDALLKKEFKHALIASVLTVGMMLVGIASNANRLIPTNEYTAYSTRGKSDLKQGGDGLKKDYIVGYSSGKDDIFSFLVPNYKGPKSGVQLVENPIAKETLGKDRNLVGQTEGLIYQNYGEIIEQYWGGTDVAGGGIYCSVIIFVLFLLGFIFVKHPIKWIIIPGFLATLLLSWGKNYMGFTSFFIDYFPMYNKFRAVNSIIIVITFCIPLLASFMLARLVNEPEFLEKPSLGKYKNKHILVGGLGLILIILLAMYAIPNAFQSFTKPAHLVDQVNKVMTEKEIITEALTTQKADDQTIYKVISDVEKGRISIFRADVLRSFIILLLGSVLLALYAFKFIKWPIMIGGIALIVLIDVWDYDSRYLNQKNFKEPKESKKEFAMTYADKIIVNDPALHKRVLNLSVSPFNDATTSYYHQSLGGYHGAKIKRYQELIENHIYPEINRVFAGTSPAKIDSLLSTAQVLNMLDTKYFIFDPNSPPLTNPYANGAAWTISNVQFVENADVEISALKTINTKTTAVIDQKFKDKIKTETLKLDTTAKITMTLYTLGRAEYDYYSSQDQVAVFSEIYYPAGWKAYIDGTEADIVRANYVLRALFVPKGKHKIEFVFEPASFKKGETYSLIASSILVLLLLGGIGLEIKKRSKKTAKK
jgi:hypothetical protein